MHFWTLRRCRKQQEVNLHNFFCLDFPLVIVASASLSLSLPAVTYSPVLLQLSFNSAKMPLENLEEEGLPKNPNLRIAQLKFLLTHRQDAKVKSELMEAIKLNSEFIHLHLLLFQQIYYRGSVLLQYMHELYNFPAIWGLVSLTKQRTSSLAANVFGCEFDQVHISSDAFYCILLIFLIANLLYYHIG